MEDFVKENKQISTISKEDRKMVNKLLNNEIGNLIRPNFVNIIDGNF